MSMIKSYDKTFAPNPPIKTNGVFIMTHANTEDYRKDTNFTLDT